MSFYTSKNANLKINGNEFVANSVELSTEASNEPVFYSDKRHSFSYAPTNGINGNLRINYYLTGADSLKTSLTNDAPLSGFFGGIYFTGGYLNSYSLNCAPNNPVTVNANVVFFDQLVGTFSPVTVKQENHKCLNFSDANIYHYGGYSSETISNVVTLNYNYSTEIEPSYYYESGTDFTNVIPSRVSIGPKKIETTILCDNLTTSLPINGKNLGIRITLQHPELSSLSEQYSCSGVMTSKNISVSAGDYVKNLITVTQYSTDEPPFIRVVNPVEGTFDDPVTIVGSGFTNATDFYFNDVPDNNFTIVDDANILAYVPRNATSGNIKVVTYGGEYTFTRTGFNIIPETLTVSSLSPLTGKAGSLIQISGANFYKIDRIFFSGQHTGQFRKINNNIFEVKVPTGATYGKVGLGSTLRNFTGYSVYEFVPVPEFTGFFPSSGVSGALITLLGRNFSGISRVAFNGITGHPINVLNNNQLTVPVPGGRSKGYITMSGFSGVTSFSPVQFTPILYITGITPTSGRLGDTVRLSGYYFDTGIMYKTDNIEGQNLFKVGFENYFTGFYTGAGDYLLTGKVPYDVIPGSTYNIYVYQNDGISTHPSNTSFKVRWNTPVVTNVNAGASYYGRQILSGSTGGFSLLGSSLAEVRKIRMTGLAVGSNIGKGIAFTNDTIKYITGSIDGKMCMVTGYAFSGYNLATGNYEVQITTIEGVGYDTGYYGYNNLGVLENRPSGIVIVKNHYWF